MSYADNISDNHDAHPHLCFIVQGPGISGINSLLQRGVTVKAQVGCSVARFLCEQVGLAPQTIAKIQSVILEGKPVDDLDQAMIRDGSTLALSAAMPGLVGATLRRGGAYSAFRSTISYRETGSQGVTGEGFVQVKLFNMLMAELGPGFLKKGVFVKAADLMDFLSEQSEDFRQGSARILLNGKPVEIGSLLHDERFLGYGRVMLCVMDTE